MAASHTAPRVLRNLEFPGRLTRLQSTGRRSGSSLVSPRGLYVIIPEIPPCPTLSPIQSSGQLNKFANCSILVGYHIVHRCRDAHQAPRMVTLRCFNLSQTRSQTTYSQAFVPVAGTVHTLVVLRLPVTFGLRASFGAPCANGRRLGGARESSRRRRATARSCQCRRGIGKGLHDLQESIVGDNLLRSTSVYLLLQTLADKTERVFPKYCRRTRHSTKRRVF